MSLSLMKQRMSVTGITPRQEMVNDTIFIETLENENDLSYCDSFYKVITQDDYDNKENYQQIHPRLYSKKWSSYKNHEMSMQTMANEPVSYGDMFYNSKDNTYWICIKSDFVGDVHYISALLQCNYLMYWQRKNGEIVSRHCTIINASSYSNGESGNSNITILSNQFLVYMVDDDITNELDNGKRINISKNINKCRPYDLTRMDDITYNFGDGLLCIMFTQDTYNPTNDFFVKTKYNKSVWICDYISDDNTNDSNSNKPQSNLSGFISYKGSDRIIAGGSGKVFTFNETDNNNNIIDISDVSYNNNYLWSYSISKELDNLISAVINDNTLMIKIEYDDMVVGRSLFIEVADVTGKTVDKIEIEIGG